MLCTPHDPAHLELLRASTLLDAPPAQRIEAARPHLSKQNLVSITWQYVSQ